MTRFGEVGRTILRGTAWVLGAGVFGAAQDRLQERFGVDAEAGFFAVPAVGPLD